MDAGQPGRVAITERRHHVRASREVDTALDCGRAGPSTEAAAAGDVGGTARRRAGQRSFAAASDRINPPSPWNTKSLWRIMPETLCRPVHRPDLPQDLPQGCYPIVT